MNAHYDDRTIKLFLLGELPEEERADIEAVALDSPELLERIEAFESEYLLDFAQGRLPREERMRVEAAYGRSPERRKRVEEARALAAIAGRVPSSRMVWMFAVAAAAVVAIVSGALWTKVREPAGRASPAAVVVVASLRLEPGLTRGVSGSGDVLKGLDGTGEGVVRIHLFGMKSSEPKIWRVALRSVDAATDSWSAEDARTDESAGAVVVDVPARILVRGDYVVKLARDGVAAAAYQFRVD